METREIFVSHSTLHPKAEWVEQQARNFLMLTDDSDHPPENETIVLDKIVRHERLGGLIKWYARCVSF